MFALPLSLAAACGPSIKNIVESDMRFEHCYRIDDDPTTPLDAKRTCWRDWTARYTRGQERSRVQYAKERVRVLDDAVTSGVGSGVAAPTTGASNVASPSPENPYAPPPSIAPSAKPTEKSGEKSGEKSAMSATPTWQPCSDGCTKTWRSCVEPCGTLAACVIACDVNFKGCMKTCL